MSSARQALFLVALFLLGGIQIPNNQVKLDLVAGPSFEGFSTPNDVWNESPFRTTAVPGGFNISTALDYSDVVVLINNQSEASRTIGWAFVSARNISTDRIFVFDNESTPTAETINRDQFNTYFLEPFRTMLSSYNGTDINYLVTTKGVPLRINGGNDKAAFDQEIALTGGTFDADIGSNWWSNHGYGPLAGKAMKEFTRDEYGFFLVTRLTGYTVDTALELIEKANNSYGSRGTHVLDLATNRNGSGYKFWNDDLYVANSTLNGTMGLPVVFNEETEFITNISNVIGYASWGSNDGNWNKNYLANGGFDTTDASWSSGSRYWNASSPNVSNGDEFHWEFQTGTKQGGAGSVEAQISTECIQESGDMLPGVYAEYFDNEGLSFNSATMPDLIDRTPDHIRIDSSIAYSSSNNPYPGLDDRFKHNWGARFSGLIEIPETGNWTLFINSDDGSELWIDGESAVQNHGMHGMRENSTTLNLSAGFHDFRIEFFQGGGPHGLLFSWQGPNVSKAHIPSSAFFVAGDYIPQSESLIHHWNFEEGSGNQTSDEVSNDSNFTLYGMNSSNWKNCVDGDCLWYDGSNDYSKVDVDDWLGNFTVSQWVWANYSNQTTYASTFAIDDVAASSQSFQHMISNSKWNLHNNQTNVFGDVVAQHWSHLVTVFEDGEARQYLDGVLVNSNTYSNGSMNNFDLYKLGVNRAGNSYFEGMIDNLMIWDTALSNGSVTALNRDIVTNCSAYSGNGQGVAYLETVHDIPTNFTNHAWVIYGYGKRTGDVYGEYNIEVDSLDANGSLLNTNQSSNQAFTTSWNSRTMRFRPHQDATSFRIKISLDIVPTSTDGSLFVDSTVLRVIRPHMEWVNGSIVETAVSTGARSFNWGTSYGQSLVADILEDGASGIKGYVYEPYLTAVASPSVLLSSYSSGYNLAESYAAANTMTSWMGVVVGDPKMSPYADIVHDVEIIDVQIVENVSINQTFEIKIAIQNLGPGEGQGTLKVLDKLGSIVLANHSMVIPNGSMNGSRQILTLQVNTSRAGWNNLVIKWDATSPLHPERNIENNQFDFVLWVNTAPVIEDVYCDSSQYSRGDRFVCSVQSVDDSFVESVDIAWRITSGNNSTEWVWLNTSSQGGYIWWASIDLPSDIPLGMLDLTVISRDEANLSSTASSMAIAQITDAPAFWFGIHISGVDDTEWGGASVLTSNPSIGVKRGHVLTLKSCVLDPDHNPVNQTPQFISSRGQIDGLSHRSGSSSDHHCYIASFTIPSATTLDPFTLELRTDSGDFLTRRTVQVADQAPIINLTLINSEGDYAENILAGGDESLKVTITDVDDPVEGV
ncbi:MAG: TIGR03790 family protein, partial [Euryarchaeota archaeon]|nr:TIGR03790 family protein [Euryarchaeota archaeon]